MPDITITAWAVKHKHPHQFGRACASEPLDKSQCTISITVDGQAAPLPAAGGSSGNPLTVSAPNGPVTLVVRVETPASSKLWPVEGRIDLDAAGDLRRRPDTPIHFARRSTLSVQHGGSSSQQLTLDVVLLRVRDQTARVLDVIRRFPINPGRSGFIPPQWTARETVLSLETEESHEVPRTSRLILRVDGLNLPPATRVTVDGIELAPAQDHHFQETTEITGRRGSQIRVVLPDGMRGQRTIEVSTPSASPLRTVPVTIANDPTEPDDRTRPRRTGTMLPTPHGAVVELANPTVATWEGPPIAFGRMDPKTPCENGQLKLAPDFFAQPLAPGFDRVLEVKDLKSPQLVGVGVPPAMEPLLNDACVPFNVVAWPALVYFHPSLDQGGFFAAAHMRAPFDWDFPFMVLFQDKGYVSNPLDYLTTEAPRKKGVLHQLVASGKPAIYINPLPTSDARLADIHNPEVLLELIEDVYSFLLLEMGVVDLKPAVGRIAIASFSNGATELSFYLSPFVNSAVMQKWVKEIYLLDPTESEGLAVGVAGTARAWFDSGNAEDRDDRRLRVFAGGVEWGGAKDWWRRVFKRDPPAAVDEVAFWPGSDAERVGFLFVGEEAWKKVARPRLDPNLSVAQREALLSNLLDFFGRRHELIPSFCVGVALEWSGFR